MKIFGLFFLLFGALSLSREYSRYVKKHLAECEEFISFIRHYRLLLKCFLKPPREIAKAFRGEAIAPFLDMLEKEENPALAFEASKGRFSLSEEENKVLSDLFSSICTCYAEDGVRLLEAADEKLTALYKELHERSVRSTRAFSTVSAAVSVGLFILLI